MVNHSLIQRLFAQTRQRLADPHEYRSPPICPVWVPVRALFGLSIGADMTRL
jgi:hypothetical protein